MILIGYHLKNTRPTGHSSLRTYDSPPGIVAINYLNVGDACVHVQTILLKVLMQNW